MTTIRERGAVSAGGARIVLSRPGRCIRCRRWLPAGVVAARVPGCGLRCAACVADLAAGLPPAGRLESAGRLVWGAGRKAAPRGTQAASRRSVQLILGLSQQVRTK